MHLGQRSLVPAPCGTVTSALGFGCRRLGVNQALQLWVLAAKNCIPFEVHVDGTRLSRRAHHESGDALPGLGDRATGATCVVRWSGRLQAFVASAEVWMLSACSNAALSVMSPARQ